MKATQFNKISLTTLCILSSTIVGLSQTTVANTTKTDHAMKVFVSLGLDKTTEDLVTKQGFKNIVDIDVVTNPDHLTYNQDQLSASIEAKIPQKESTSLVVLDWEGEVLSVLLQKDTSSVEYKKVSDQFISAYQLVKSKRPLVTCGFYGLPFKTYWKRDSNWVNKCLDLSPLLSHFDALFPSVYIPYRDDIDVKENENINFIKDNLNTALRLGYELKKPLYVFIWHRYHESNAKYGLQLIPENYFKDQIKAIAQASYKDKKPDGIIWWSAEQYFSNVVSKKKSAPELRNYKFSDRDTTLKYLQIINQNL